MNGSGSGKEETNVIDSHGLGNGGVRTFHSAALRWQSLMEITELERLRLQKEERKKKLRIDDVELPLQEITTSNRPVQAPPRPGGRQNQKERRIVPVDRSEVRLQPKNPRNNEIQPSTTITTSDPFLQTTPIFSDQGLGGLKHTLGGILRRRVTADRFWQNLQVQIKRLGFFFSSDVLFF
ncbi:hypothetical protein QJS04_geneDACA021965 [Acorus gramineus]|uniref:Uncharacterized protein n=1 Tax=Acorus gramineus TaxID=55184 RepID=A0AAV9AAH7_ACOGR|nr:hypothetical protein QJS04_geneDACA021965 [Acorus gramineus]